MNDVISVFTGEQIDAILGSFGVPKSLPNNTNLNTIVNQGLYYSQNTAASATMTNLPTGLTGGFMLLVFKVGNDRNVVHQVIIPNNDGAVFLRKSFDTDSTFIGWYRAETYNCTFKKVGTTAERVDPVNGGGRSFVGDMYFDTTLKKPVFYVGNTKDSNNQIISSTGWVDATGTPV